MFKKIIFRTLAFFILIFAFLFAYPRVMGLFIKDTSAPNISGLELKESGSIPEDQNIYFFLKKIIEANPGFDKISSKISDYNSHQPAGSEKTEIEKLLSDYSGITESFMKVASLSFYQNPNLPKNLDDSYDFTKYMTEFAKSMSVLSFNNSYAQFIASKGKTEEALEILFQNLRVQSLILESNLSLMQYAVVQQKLTRTLNVFIMIASKSNWDAEKIKKFGTVLVFRSPEKTKQELINSMKVEFFINSSLINSFIKQGLRFDVAHNLSVEYFSRVFRNSGYYFQPNQIKKTMVEFYKKKMDDIKIDCKNPKSLDKTANKKQSLFSMYFTRNSIGKTQSDTFSYWADQKILTITENSCEINDLAEKVKDLINNTQQ